MHGLEPHGGGGIDNEYKQEFWAWPLPGEGTVAFVCEWPAHDIPETRIEIDGQLFADAAQRAVPVWSDATGSNTHVTRSSMMRRAASIRGQLRVRSGDEESAGTED